MDEREQDHRTDDGFEVLDAARREAAEHRVTFLQPEPIANGCSIVDPVAVDENGVEHTDRRFRNPVGGPVVRGNAKVTEVGELGEFVAVETDRQVVFEEQIENDLGLLEASFGIDDLADVATLAKAERIGEIIVSPESHDLALSRRNAGVLHHARTQQGGHGDPPHAVRASRSSSLHHGAESSA